MRKMFKLLVLLFLMYFGLQFLFYFFSKGHKVSYEIGTDSGVVTINETLTVNKEFSDGYYFEVIINGRNIPFKIFDKLTRKKRVVNDVKIYDGNIYTCYNIAINGDYNISDIKCISNGIIYFYSTIKGRDPKVDSLIASSDYDSSKYAASNLSAVKEGITYYKENYVEDHNVLISGYKGAYLFGRDVTGDARFVVLHNNDQYTKTIEGLADKYYIGANYNGVHEFINFNIINIVTGEKYEIPSPNYISYSSFVQGSSGNKLYIIDTQAKRQYAIDAKERKVEIVGNANIGASVYTNEGWVTKNINEVIDHHITFYTEKMTNFNGVNYNLVKHVGEKDGIYYLFSYNGSKYDVYLVYAEDSEFKKNYVFSCDDLDRIYFIDKYVYYLDGDDIKVFSQEIGNRPIVTFSELRYNTGLHYYAY